MFDLDQAVAQWRQQMSADGIKNSATLDELESHLRDDIEEIVVAGALRLQPDGVDAQQQILQRRAAGIFRVNQS